MATTSIIAIDGHEEIGIYKHYDGYPSGMIPWLKDFHGDYLKNGGWDPSYELAQLLRYSARFYDKYNGLDDDWYNSWGIVKTKDYLTNYKYTLCEKGIKIYKFDHEVEDYILVDVETLEEKEENI